jgi:hypothetical protein
VSGGTRRHQLDHVPGAHAGTLRHALSEIDTGGRAGGTRERARQRALEAHELDRLGAASEHQPSASVELRLRPDDAGNGTRGLRRGRDIRARGQLRLELRRARQHLTAQRLLKAREGAQTQDQGGDAEGDAAGAHRGEKRDEASLRVLRR